MKYKIIFSDYDGTTAIGKIVSQNVKNAIKNYRNAGGKFIFCTGRHECSIKDVLNTNGIEVDGFITMQGAGAIVDNKVIVDGGLSPKTVVDIVSDAIKSGIYPSIWQKDKLFYFNESNSKEYAGYFKKVIEEDKIEMVTDVNRLLDSEYGYYGKLIFNKASTEFFNYFIPYVNEKYGNEVVANSSGPNFIEVVSKNYTKYETTKKVSEYLGFNENEVITVGDSSNDLTLLKYGFGIAVGNADAELKKIAKFISPSVTDNALEYIINKVLNNEDFI